MTITLYNTRSRAAEAFAPIDPANVRMYVCGPTVYDRAHLGNARPVVAFDLLYRLLRHAYGAAHVTYVRNFTDVDDKIIAKAQGTLAPGEALEAACARITDETIRWYHEDMDALGALRPDHEPRCTAYIPEMVAMTGDLIAKGHAYEAEGHVLFAARSWPDYGLHARKPLDEMLEGARVEVAPWKRDPMDFVLWKPSTPDQPGWESPWGRGRPGWHIECSAMARALLGEVFDIHGGGIDLIFPHHQNEIAQSCCAHGTDRMANFWLYNGFLNVEGQKMSKSLGNFFTVRDLLDQGIPGEVIRLVLLSTHYTKPMDWTAEAAGEKAALLRGWARLKHEAARAGHAVGGLAPDALVVNALADDLNVPEALRRLHEMARDARLPEAEADPLAPARFFSTLDFLGFPLEHFLGEERAREGRKAEVGPLIEGLLAARAEARRAKDFARADAIRKGLDAAGVVVMDRPGGPTEWDLAASFDAALLEALR